MPAQPSIWKKEIKLRREKPAAVQAVAAQPQTRAEPLPPPIALAPQVELEPRFRRVDVLGRLLDQYAEEFPDRAEERRKMLARLAESAEDGVLSPDLDGVIHTLFYDLLRRGLKPSKQFWKRENSTPKPRKASKQKASAAPAGTTSIWKKEISLGRSSQPKEKVAAAGGDKTPWWKKELSVGRSSQPKEEVVAAVERDAEEAKTSFWKRQRSPKEEIVAQVELETEEAKTPFWKKELGRSSSAKAERPKRSRPKREKAPREPKAPKEPKVKAAKAPKEPKVKEPSGDGKALLRREVRLPKPSLPRFSGVALPSLRRGGEVSKIVGLRIGSSQLAAALVNNNGAAEVVQLARSPLERGIVAGGEVRDTEALAESLKRFFAHHKLPRRGVRLGIATNRIGVRVLEVPVMEDPKQLANAIRFRAQEVLPIPIGEAVLDHVVIGETHEGGAAQHRVLLVFAHRDLVDGYMEACDRAGLRLLGIDFDAFALLRALADETEARGAALIAVSIGHERTIFAVSDGKICDFARVLEWGGSSLDLALARALEVEPDEAERIKQLLTLDGDCEIEGVTPVQLEAARAAVRQELQLLARELVSSLQFYQSRPGSLDIGEMLLTGGGAQLDGIDAELGSQLGVPVRLGDPLQRVKLGKDVPHPASPSLTIAVGLGIEEKD